MYDGCDGPSEGWGLTERGAEQEEVDMCRNVDLMNPQAKAKAGVQTGAGEGRTVAGGQTGDARLVAAVALGRYVGRSRFAR